MPSGDIKRMDIKEFRELGFLQEVNRKFLHPLGLALEVQPYDDGTEVLGGIWDYRDDPEGMCFAPGEIDPLKALRVEEEYERHRQVRSDSLGYVVQPVVED